MGIAAFPHQWHPNLEIRIDLTNATTIGSWFLMEHLVSLIGSEQGCIITNSYQFVNVTRCIAREFRKDTRSDGLGLVSKEICMDSDTHEFLIVSEIIVAVFSVTVLASAHKDNSD
jgi:hypothetical protein